jgi:hypothetical protein
VRNLSTLRSLAGAAGAASLLKVYVRDPAQAQIIADRLSEVLPPEFCDSEIIYLSADICRRELLLEIEGVQLPAER